MRRVLVLMAVLSLAVPVVAQERPVVDRAEREVAAFLGLEESQVTAWEGLLETRGAAVKALQEEMDPLEEQLAALLGQTSPDPAAVGALVIQVKGLKEEIRAANDAYQDGFEALLTEEQAGKLGVVRRAARLEPIVPAFRLLGLVPDLPRAVEGKAR